MDQNEGLEPPTPPPADTDPDELRIVEATAIPGFVPDETLAQPPVAPVAATPPAPTVDTYAHAETQVVPVVPVVPPPTPVAQTAAYAPVPPVHDSRATAESERGPAWPYVAAVVALLLGGLIGYLIGAAGDDDEAPAVAPGADIDETLDTLLVRTQAAGEWETPSEYPQIDQITEIDNAAATRELQGQIDALTEESAGLTEQVAALEVELAEVTAERDALAADTGDTGDDQQADLDAANAEIEALEAELETARTDLEAANEALAAAEATLQTTIEERDAANATIADLNILPNPDYVDGAVDAARDDAAENGWTLIEQPTESATAAPGTIIDQAPPPDTNMINGSVLFVTVAEAP